MCLWITFGLCYHMSMQYAVSLKSSVVVDADTPAEATEQVEDCLAEARKRNCGGIEDEILADTMMVRVQKQTGSSE